MSHWNYRILKHKDGTYGVHEVFYGSSWVEDGPDDPDQLTWTLDVVPEGLEAESLEELRAIINHLYLDTQKSVIDEEATVNNGYKEVTE